MTKTESILYVLHAQTDAISLLIIWCLSLDCVSSSFTLQWKIFKRLELKLMEKGR